MEKNIDSRFNKGIICSSVAIILLIAYCLVEMIVSWCVQYTRFYLGARIALAAVFFIAAIVYATQYKKIGIFPALVCSVLFFALMIDFFTYRKANVFLASSDYVNTLRIYPFVMWFDKHLDLTLPENAGLKSENRQRFYVATIIFVVALIVGIILLAVSIAVKKKKLQISIADKALRWTTIGFSVFLFLEFIRALNTYMVTLGVVTNF